MHERFSDRARHAMALANREAVEMKHDFLGPEHILLGIIAEGECVGAAALRVLEVDLDRIRQEVVRELASVSAADPQIGRRPYNAATRHLIENAIAEARTLGHRYVGTEHLVLGLLRLEDGAASRILRSQGVKPDALREKVLSMLRGAVGATHDLAHLRHGEFEWAHQQELAKAFRSTAFWHTLILAVDSANRYGDGEVGPLHLLLALLRDDQNDAARLLAEKGVTVEWVRAHITQSAPAV
ncbi:MAG TPA: Clp protease N-terminal domain-containing protein [Phycisphaerae bacterium]